MMARCVSCPGFMPNPSRRARRFASQALRTVTNKKHGFKVKVPRFVKVDADPSPTKIRSSRSSRASGTIKAPQGLLPTRHPKTGKKTEGAGRRSFEIWVVPYREPEDRRTQAKAPITLEWVRRVQVGGSRTTRPMTNRETRRSQVKRRQKNSGPDDRRSSSTTDSRACPPGIQLQESRTTSRHCSGQGQADVRDPRSSTRSRSSAWRNPGCGLYTSTHDHPHFGHELFGMVWRLPAHGSSFQKLVAPCVKSLQRRRSTQGDGRTPRPIRTPDSKLPSTSRSAAAIRSRLVKGWYAEDTKSFILVTDLTNNSSNRQLLKDMLIDLEIMRKEYEKRFPPVKPVRRSCARCACATATTATSATAAKPGTGGLLASARRGTRALQSGRQDQESRRG